MPTLVCALISIACLLSACSAAERDGKANAAAIKFGIFENFSTFYAGKASGAFDGVDLQTTVIDSGPAALPLVKRGSLDGIDEAGVVPTLIAQATRVPVKVVWLTSTYRYRFVVNDSIKSPEDLKGRSIATVPGSVLEFYLDRYLTDNGMSPTDVKRVDLPPPSMPSALKTRQIDGALVWDPFAAEMVNYGGHSLTNVDDLSMVLMSEPFVTAQPAQVQKLVCALSKTQEGFIANPGAGYHAIAQALKMSPEDVQTNMPPDSVFSATRAAAYLTAGTPESRSLTDLLDKSGGWLAAKGSIPAAPSKEEVASLIDDTFAKKAADGQC